MTTVNSTAKPFILSWPCLQDDSPLPPPQAPLPNLKPLPHKKTFAQAVNNICDIPVSQLPKPCLKGDYFAIDIPDEEYEAGLADCKHNLHGRIILPKGSSPINVDELRAKLAGIWKSIGRWGITSIGKGFFELSFSSLEDLRRVRSVGTWNVKPGILKLFTWTKDFSTKNQHQTSVQVWMRIYGLSQEYWRKNILFAIASSVGTPICTDNISCKPLMERSFGHFARVLVDLDLSDQLRDGVMVQRKGYAFYVDFEYENLPDFCTYCKSVGHYVDICRRRKTNESEKVVQPKANVDRRVAQNKVYVEKPKETAVRQLEPSPKPVNSGRNQEDVNLENEINDELQATQNVEKNRVHTENVEVEDASSSDESEFVDATQRQDEDNGTDLPESVNTTPEVVLKDVHLLKEAWADLAQLDENEVNKNPTTEHEGIDDASSGTSTSLTKVQQVNQDADAANPSSADQGFQTVTSKTKKKAEKARMVKQGIYTTRSKVGNPKPFK
jgi:hypothetical protein